MIYCTVEIVEDDMAPDVEGSHATFGSADAYTYGVRGYDPSDGNLKGSVETV